MLILKLRAAGDVPRGDPPGDRRARRRLEDREPEALPEARPRRLREEGERGAADHDLREGSFDPVR